MKVADMNGEFARLKNDIDALMETLTDADFFVPGEDLLIRCSTSEVIGHHIGMQSSMEVAELIFDAFIEVAAKFDSNIMLHGSEHINRVVRFDRDVAKYRAYDTV